MTRLTDTQTILLSSAAQQDGGSVYPLPATITASGARLTKALTTLVDRGFLVERETDQAADTYRAEGEVRYGIYVTQAGLAAIGIDACDDGPDDIMAPAPAPTPVATPRVTKGSTVLSLLQRDGGATLAELIDATGWLPHTTRAALTGLRKKGHAVVRGKRDEQTC
ncbi:DUF3489 domain-containing protein, partial [Sphingomonas sp. RS2018]